MKSEPHCKHFSTLRLRLRLSAIQLVSSLVSFVAECVIRCRCRSMLGMSVQNESRVPYLRDPATWCVVRVCALGASPLVLVLALGELLDDLGAERRHVVGVAARDESLVDDDFLVHPIAPSVADVRPEGWV